MFSIFTAFVIEAFLLEYEISDKSAFEIKIENKINELGLNIDSNQTKTEPYIYYLKIIY